MNWQDLEFDLTDDLPKILWNAPTPNQLDLLSWIIYGFSLFKDMPISKEF